MIPEWAEPYLGEDGVADVDPRSGEPVAWGRQVTSQMPEGLFDKLRGEVELVCVHPGWYVIERRVQYDTVALQHGGVKVVGVGPSGGFKWVCFTDGTLWGHKYFRDGAMREAGKNPRLVVKCDKDGNEKGEAPRLPRLAVGHHAGRKRR